MIIASLASLEFSNVIRLPNIVVVAPFGHYIKVVLLLIDFTCIDTGCRVGVVLFNITKLKHFNRY